MNKCVDCLCFVRFLGGNLELGTCRAAAPIIIPNTKHSTGVWPIVSITSGCVHDFVPREAKSV